MNICDAVITKVHYIRETISSNPIPNCAKWECKYTYNCYGSETTITSYGYCGEELNDKYKEGEVIFV